MRDPSISLLAQFKDIVDFLQNGEGTRAEFMASIRRHEDNIKFLSSRYMDAIKSLDDLEEVMSIAAPPFTVGLAYDKRMEEPTTTLTFDLRFQGGAPFYRTRIADDVAAGWRLGTPAAMRERQRFIRNTYRTFCRCVRKMLAKTIEEANL